MLPATLAGFILMKDARCEDNDASERKLPKPFLQQYKVLSTVGKGSMPHPAKPGESKGWMEIEQD